MPVHMLRRAGKLDLSKNAQAEALLAGYVFYHARRNLFRLLSSREGAMSHRAALHASLVLFNSVAQLVCFFNYITP